MYTRPVRLQLSRRAGFNLQELSRAINGREAVSVARRSGGPGKWGNPHAALRCWYHGAMPELGLAEFDAVTAADADREGRRIAVALYRRDAEARPAADFAELAGRNLACWCPLPARGEPDICHAAVLLELANPEPDR